MDDDIFQQQLKQQLVMIFHYLIKLGAKREDAEDIVQETALKYMAHLESVPAEKAKSWMFRVAINHYYDILRKQKVKDQSLLELRFVENLTSDLPEDYLLKKEQHKEIRNTLELLPPKYKEFLVLKYAIGLRYEDIALSFGISPGTVKTSIFRAKKSFINTYRSIQNEKRE